MVIPDSETQKKLSKQAKLDKALAEIKILPDAYFDALMEEMGLSTARTPLADQPQQNEISHDQAQSNKQQVDSSKESQHGLNQ